MALQLEDWETGDWNEQRDFDPALNVHKKKSFFESSLAFNTSIFESINPLTGEEYIESYRLRNEKTAFPDGTSPGVPGPFSYDLGWNKWGGDTLQEMGTQYYGEIIGHFGHTHILTLQEKVMIRACNPKADTTAQDLMLKHLENGSTQIFSKYADVVDINGNRKPIDNTPSGQLRGLMFTLIVGEGLQDGVIPLDFILGAFRGLANGAEKKSTREVLNQEVDIVQSYLSDVLGAELKDVIVDGVKTGVTVHSQRITLQPWAVFMAGHQEGLYLSFEMYREAYKYPRCKHKADAANKHAHHNFDMGRKFAAFFGLFYSAVAILDQLVPVHKGNYHRNSDGTDKEYAIPRRVREYNEDGTRSGIETLDVLRKRVTRMHVYLKRYWYEHVTMFEDYLRVAAQIASGRFKSADSQNQVLLYRIRLNMLESCAQLALDLGEIFRAFDKLIRKRDIYSKIGT